MGEGDDGKLPFLREVPTISHESSSSSGEEEGKVTNRTGNVWTATAHIITAVIGSGVLSLGWSMAQLGWVAGPLSMVAFAAITLVQSTLLADCYRSPDPEHGYIRNHMYTDAVKLNLGKRSLWACGLVQQLNLYGVGIAYTITSANSMRAIQKSNCYHREGHDASCAYGISSYMLMFGAVQIVCSLIPDFHNMEWLSIVAAIMSFSYSSIAFVLGLAKVIGDGSIKGSLEGIVLATSAQKIWRVAQAIGDIAFSYPFATVLLAIQDTLKSPPPENQTMKKASRISILITTSFYLCCGCFGYAAFGDSTPGNLLTGFGFYEPYWLIDFANACIVLHLVGGYQVFSQHVFAFVEHWFAKKFPGNGFANKFYTIQIPSTKPYRLKLLSLCFRTIYVVSTTGIAMLYPYFNQVLGVLGGLSFWLLAIYFPVEMYIVQRKIGIWSREWVLLQILSIVCFAVSMFALVGSLEGLFTEKLT